MMTPLDIRAAAQSATMYVGTQRTEFIKNYPQEYRHTIELLANEIDDYANCEYEESRLEPCKYNRGFTYGV